MPDVFVTSPNLVASGADLAVLPVGAIEQHGPHLPLATDWLIADGLGREIGRQLEAYVLPAIPFSVSEVHRGFRGSVSLRPETLSATVQELCGDLLGQGFKAVAVVNVHGGNFILRPAVRAVNLGRDRDRGRALLVDPFAIGAARVLEVNPGWAGEIHAGGIETSLILHLRPELVGPERPDAVPACPRDMLDCATVAALSPVGVWGRASLASAEEGARLFAALVDESCRYIRDRLADLSALASL